MRDEEDSNSKFSVLINENILQFYFFVRLHDIPFPRLTLFSKRLKEELFDG